MHSELKTATDELHAQVEQLLFGQDIRAGKLTLLQYKHLLKVNFLFHDALERSMPRQAQQLEGLDYQQRMKSHLLRKDLAALGESVPEQRLELSINSIPEALGMLYVAEGSTLGGRVILKVAQNIKEVSACPANAFYSVYGNDVGLMWKRFLAILDGYSYSENEKALAVQSAQKGFRLIAEAHHYLNGQTF